jgi:signal transduction histidine kinase
MSEIDLVELIADIHHEQAEVLNHYNLLFRSCDELRIRGDKRRLERVIINLLSNSTKYSPEGTTIIMKAERRDLHAVFSITDQGAGMSDEDVKSLFQPFGRLAHTKHMAHGTGLGLFSVRKIIDAHGGSISVTSELGVGTTVEVSLPIAESISD